MGSKSEIRNSSLLYRAALTHDQIQEKSTHVISRVASIVGVSPSEVLSYMPLLAQSEIDLHHLEKLLPASSFKYIEPKTNAHMPQELYTHIIIPCVAADTFGHRLGYGKGWYDRFLLQQPDAITIGVCYEKCIVNKLPHETHDVKLNYIVTENRIIAPSVE
jgi:5-formyltetrahydrofolate cyclo-ligase